VDKAVARTDERDLREGRMGELVTETNERPLRGARLSEHVDEVGTALHELEQASVGVELLRSHLAEEIGAYRSLMEALEKRAALLDVLAQRLDPRQSFARVGEELEQPGLRELSLVGATYGLAHQTLGAVSLLGPLRMDYEKALHSVRAAAHELSRFVEDAYEGD